MERITAERRTRSLIEGRSSMLVDWARSLVALLIHGLRLGTWFFLS